MWKSINFNAQNIECESDKATLIKMPNNSNYEGYVFWHPSKLVREIGGKGYHLSFSFTDDFKFKVFKSGKGKHNFRKIIKETELSAEEMLEEFGVVNESIENSEAKHKAKEEKSYLIVEEPLKIDKEIQIEDELKNDERAN